MQLGVALRRRGFKVVGPKPGPDFLVEDELGRIWIEAVTTREGAPRKPDTILAFEPGVAADVPNDGYVLRLTSVMEEKRKKFLQYRENDWVQPNDRCIIAVCNGMPGSHIVTYQHALRAVFPLGHQYVSIDRKTMKTVGEGYTYQDSLEPVAASKPAIKKTAFVADDWPQISAMLF